MKIHGMITIVVFLATVFTACTSVQVTTPPAWVNNAQAVYPREVYITGRGSGSGRQEAEGQALAAIALHFNREVEVLRSARVVLTERDGVFTSERVIEEKTLVESSTRLVAVRYAEDPWYNPATKTWETIAYIEREEGWLAYEPTAQRQAGIFLNLVKAAEEETEPFNAVLRYGTAMAYERGAEFNTVRNFAQVLHSTRANLLFAEADLVLAGLLERQINAREKAVIFIECPVDHDRIVYQAMVTALGNAGFATESNRNTGTRCIVRVEEGRQVHDSGIIYYPSLTATISGSNGAIMSFRVTGGRAGAINPDLAKRRAYTSLAIALEGAFSSELQRWQSALVSN